MSTVSVDRRVVGRDILGWNVPVKHSVYNRFLVKVRIIVMKNNHP
jgi:hypothetical protein